MTKTKTPTIQDLGGSTWRILRFVDQNDKRWSAFNPSIAYSPTEGYVVLIRASNYFFDPASGATVPTIGSKVLNRMFMANLSSSWEIDLDTLREIDFSGCGNWLRGPEDGRLYWRDGHWEILSVMREPHISNDIPRLATYILHDNKAELVKLHVSGNLQPMEKNWMPTYEKNPEFDFVYSAGSVYVVDVGKVKVREATEDFVRGGSCLWDLGDFYLAVVHDCETTYERRYSNRRFAWVDWPSRRYYHRFAKYSKSGALVGLSDRFTFQDVNIEFAAGLVIDGDDVIMSYGYKDVASYLAKIKLDIVMELINDIDS